MMKRFQTPLSGRCKAVQIDPIKPTLKAPGTKRLKPDMMIRLQTSLSN
jgi:hypothetical protein